MGENRKRGEERGKNSGMGGEGKEGDFQKFKILTASMLCSANLQHRANFVQVGQAVQEIWPYIEFFIMAAVCHLGLTNFGNFNCPDPSGAKMCHHAKFCADRSNLCGDMAVFDISRWRRLPSWILKSSTF